jgi:hypothetical protein
MDIWICDFFGVWRLSFKSDAAEAMRGMGPLMIRCFLEIT